MNTPPSWSSGLWKHGDSTIPTTDSIIIVHFFSLKEKQKYPQGGEYTGVPTTESDREPFSDGEEEVDILLLNNHSHIIIVIPSVIILVIVIINIFLVIITRWALCSGSRTGSIPKSPRWCRGSRGCFRENKNSWQMPLLVFVFVFESGYPWTKKVHDIAICREKNIWAEIALSK